MGAPNQIQQSEVVSKERYRMLRRTVRGNYVSVVERLMGGGIAYGMTLLGDWLLVWVEEDGRVTVVRSAVVDAGVRELLLNIKTFRDFDELFLRYVWEGHD